MRKNLAIILVICLIMTTMSVFAVAEPKVSLEVSEADSHGNVTAYLKVYNTSFQGIEAVISYNPECVTPNEESIKQNFGQKVTSSQNLLTLVEGRCDTEKGLITVAGITNISQPVPSELVSEDYRISAGSDGVTFATITFSKIKDGNNGIKFAVTEDFDGVILAENGKTLSFTAEVKNNGEVITYEVSGNDKSDFEKRQERLKGTIIFQIGNYAVSKEGTLCHVDTANKNVFPFIKNDRTLVPLRFIAESLGLEVLWDEQTETVTLTKEENELIFTINKSTYTKNGEELTLDSPPILQESRTFVPLRAVSEGFDKDVCWIENTNSVVISPKDNPWDIKNAIEQELMNDTMIILSPFIRDMV